jgi:hypothetical protein
LVVVSGGSEFDFQSADDFLTPNPDINGDFLNPFVGSCKQQWPQRRAGERARARFAAHYSDRKLCDNPHERAQLS